MDEEERQKLIEYRKKRQKEKELENDLQKDLKSEELNNDIKSIREENENKFLNAVIIFFGTLLPLYLFVFGFYLIFQVLFGAVLAMVGISLGWLPPLLHTGIWIASTVSVYRERSVLDNLVDRFA